MRLCSALYGAEDDFKRANPSTVMDDWWTTGTRMISKEADVKSAKANLADIDAGDR